MAVFHIEFIEFHVLKKFLMRGTKKWGTLSSTKKFCHPHSEIFSICAPVRYAPPITEHVSLHSKS